MSPLDPLHHAMVIYLTVIIHACLQHTLFLTELHEERLWNACMSGDISQVKELTAEGVNPNWKRPDMSVSDF